MANRKTKVVVDSEMSFDDAPPLRRRDRNDAAELARAATEDKLVTSQIASMSESWIKSYWRPAMAWLYMLICFMDFVGFPIFTMFMPVFLKLFSITYTYEPWVPISLTNGGIIHMAFGGILGVTAWTRGREKLASMGNL